MYDTFLDQTNNVLVPSRKERRGNGDTDEMSVVVPHKLFQEYTAGLYLAKLYSSNRERYDSLCCKIVTRKEEYRYVFFFLHQLQERTSAWTS